MKKMLLLCLATLTLSVTSLHTTSAADAVTEDTLKTWVSKLCTSLKDGDKTTFESMLADKTRMQWWWESSGKGKYFPNLYGKCEYDHLDAKQSTETKKKVFVQRFDKEGKKWSRPAPVVFEKNDKGEWLITSYSI